MMRRFLFAELRLSLASKVFLLFGGFKHEVQHGITIDETPLQVF